MFAHGFEHSPDRTLAWLFYIELGFLLLLITAGWIRGGRTLSKNNIRRKTQSRKSGENSKGRKKSVDNRRGK